MAIKKLLPSCILSTALLLPSLSFAYPGQWQQHGHDHRQMRYSNDFNRNRLLGRFLSPRHHRQIIHAHPAYRNPYYNNWYR